MKNISRPLLAGVLAFTLLHTASRAEAIAPTAAQASSELCAEATAIEVTTASSKGATVLTFESWADIAGDIPQKTITKRAANGNMSVETVTPTTFDETKTLGALHSYIETPEALYESYLPGYVEGLKADQWVRTEREELDFSDFSLFQVFDAIDMAEWFADMSLAYVTEASAQTGVESEDGLCKYSFVYTYLEDTEASTVITVDADGHLRSVEYKEMGGYAYLRYSFEYSPVVVEAPPEATWAPESVVEAVRARREELLQDLSESTAQTETETEAEAETEAEESDRT
jgi:hypothetical protein